MSGKKRKKHTVGILQYGSLSPSQKQHKIRRIYSIWKRCPEKVTGRPTLHPPEGGNRLWTIKNFQAPSIPAYLHLEISFSPLKKSQNDALKYQKAYDQMHFLKGKTAASAVHLSQVLGSSTMTNVSSVMGLFRYAAQASQQPHQMALSRSQQEEQPSWARTRERNRGKQTEAKYLIRKLQLRPV